MNRFRICFGLFLTILTIGSFSAPYSGQVMEFSQPDGTTVQVKIYGDEYYQHVESLDGYTLIRNPQSNWIEYAQTNDDSSDFIATGARYDHHIETDPNNPIFKRMAQKSARMQTRIGDKKPLLDKKQRLRKDVVTDKVRQRMKEIDPKLYNKMFSSTTGETVGDIQAAASASGSETTYPALTGSVIGLTILIDFSDVPATIPQADIVDFCNKPGYTGYSNAGSVYDYFYGVSNGKVQYTNYVTTYYRAKKTKAYYDNSCGSGLYTELVDEALRWLDSTGFNFNTVTISSGRIKALNFFYAGDTACDWSKGLWPIKGWYSGFTSDDGVSSGDFQISNMGSSPSIYVFCHENGHMICGYPDLYDYGGQSAGAGNYCIMAGRPNDKKPNPPCGYLRSTTGWETVIDITSDPVGTLRQHTANTNVSFKYTNPNNSREFFMIESRLKTGRSEMIPAEGLLIFHVDEDGSNDNEQMTVSQHYKVSVEQADGLFHLEKNNNGGDSGDSFRSGYKDTFDDYTAPNANWWNATASGLSITQVSAVSAQMSFSVGASLPVAYWKCNGNGNDSSTAAKPLMLSGSPVWSSETWNGGLESLGQCLVFDGMDDYGQAAGVADSAASIGVAFWLRSDVLRQSVLMDKFPAGSGGAGWRIWVDDLGRLHFTIGSETSSMDVRTGQPVVVPGQWRHVGCSFSAGKACIFINGQQVVEAVSITQTPASTETLTVGKSNAVALGVPFAGRLDEIAVYSTSINDVRIMNLPGMKFAGRYGLGGYWKFEDLAGTAAADSGALNYHGMLNGGMTCETSCLPGKIGRAMIFDGTDDYISVPTATTPGSGFSVCLWAYPTAVKNWARFIDFGNGAPSSNLILARDSTTNNLVVEIYNGATNGGKVSAINAIELNKWQFFAATLDASGNVKIYKNGTQVASGTSGILPKIARSNCYIGRSNWSADAYYQGLMDEVRFFNDTLTQAQVQSLMDGGSACDPSPRDYEAAASSQTLLQWKATTSSILYGIYLGTDAAAVAAATSASPEFMGYRSVTQFNPGTLTANTVYYWRVDTVLTNGVILPGSVWSFTTSGSLTRQVYTGISGDAVSNLTSSANYPGSPDSYEYITTFEGPTNVLDNYGTRIEGYITPQTSGTYYFYIAGDDGTELWLSTDADPANVVKIAYSTAYTSSRQWTKYTTQKSAAKSLVAGQKYYVRALHKEGTGGDSVAVGWQGPDSPTLGVIQGQFLSPYVARPVPMFADEVIAKASAMEGKAYQSTISGDIVTAGTYTFTKISGPSWLTVSAAGALTGTPANGDKGLNSFMVQASNSLGQVDQAVITIQVGESYDGGMGMSDLPGFASNWLSTQADNPANLNTDSIVNMADASILSANWRKNLVPGLVGLWSMDDAVNTSQRDGYTVYNGTAVNMLCNRTTPGIQGNALSFDGVDDYAVMTGFKGVTGTSARTCMAWIKAPTAATEGTIMAWGNGSNVAGEKWLLRLLTTGKLTMGVYGGYIEYSPVINDDKWHHVAVVLDNDGTPTVGEIKMYIDGQPQTGMIFNGSQAINTASTSDFCLGSRVSSEAVRYYYKGQIDEVRVFDRALTELEVSTFARKGLVACWPMNDVIDGYTPEIINGYRGTLKNMSTMPQASGKWNGSLSFDGSNDYITIPGYKGITGTASRSCSAWIKAALTGQNESILSWGNNANGENWLFRLEASGKLAVGVWGGAKITNKALNDNQWHHVAAVLDSDGTPSVDEIKLYIDGQLQMDATYTSIQPINTSVAGDDVQIGSMNYSGTQSLPFLGYLDEVMIFNRALSDAEVAGLAK